MANHKAALAVSNTKHSAAMSRLRATSNGAVARLQGRLREAKAKERVQAAGIMVATDVGAVISGQLAKPTVFMNDSTGMARGHLVNYAAGGVGFALILGARPTMAVVAIAAGLNGMLAGQLAIKSRDEWDLWPFGKDAP